RLDRRQPDVHAATLVSLAVRLERRPPFSDGPRAQRSRVRNVEFVRPNRSAWKGEGLDPGDAIEGEARAHARVHPQPHAHAAVAAQPHPRAVRSRCAAGRNRAASQKRPASCSGREDESWITSTWCIQRIRIGAARDSWATGYGEGG